MLHRLKTFLLPPSTRLEDDTDYMTEKETQSEHTRENETPAGERHVEALILSKLHHIFQQVEQGNTFMASNFAALSAAVDAAVTEINNLKAELLAAQTTNSADQATIDALTAKLAAVEPAPASTAPGTAPVA